MEFSPPRLVGLDDYLKTPGGQRLREFIARQTHSEIRIVYLSAKMAGQGAEETGALIVRVRGGRAHVIGIGEVKDNRKR